MRHNRLSTMGTGGFTSGLQLPVGTAHTFFRLRGLSFRDWHDVSFRYYFTLIIAFFIRFSAAEKALKIFPPLIDMGGMAIATLSVEIGTATAA